MYLKRLFQTSNQYKNYQDILLSYVRYKRQGYQKKFFLILLSHVSSAQKPRVPNGHDTAGNVWPGEWVAEGGWSLREGAGGGRITPLTDLHGCRSQQELGQGHRGAREFYAPNVTEST